MLLRPDHIAYARDKIAKAVRHGLSSCGITFAGNINRSILAKVQPIVDRLIEQNYTVEEFRDKSLQIASRLEHIASSIGERCQDTNSLHLKAKKFSQFFNEIFEALCADDTFFRNLEFCCE